MELLRFFTAGNVDDGKSTLIGRLLYDSNSVSTDIIQTLTRQSKNKSAKAQIDLALLTDGLRAEREQGITIDVAYKYFSTAKRKFIIADTPGHIQYTRNMFTGASRADLAIILVDARHGITDQTRRHSAICKILEIPKILVCINKMDLVNYAETTCIEIVNAYQAMAEQLGIENVSFIPASALAGDNVVLRSEHMPWYHGPALLEFLETVNTHEDTAFSVPRLQVQYIIRPQTKENPDYRGIAGSVQSGAFKKGQRVTVLPSGIETDIEKIELNQVEVDMATRNQPVVLHLKDQVDISRGNSIALSGQLPKVATDLVATICWMDHAAGVSGQKLLLQQGSFRTKAVLKEVITKTDIHSFAQVPAENVIQLNEICNVRIKTADPVSFDWFRDNRNTGAFILVNEHTNQTVAAGTFCPDTPGVVTTSDRIRQMSC